MTTTTIFMGLPLIYLALQAFAAVKLPQDWIIRVYAPLCIVSAAAVIFVIAAALGAPSAILPLYINLPLATLYLAGLVLSWGLGGETRAS